MLILNRFDEPVNILHFCGQSIKDFPMTIQNVYNNIQLNQINIPIISCWTDDSKCLLKGQLSKFNIPLINSVPENYKGEWFMPNKILFILSTLINKVKDDIVMILDGYDVLFASTDGIVDKFKKFNTQILFNATPHNYPDEIIDIIPNREEYGHYKYFNAGCCIGYRKSLIEFYSQCIEFLHIENPLNSEQKILRHVFARYSENNPDFVTIDYNNKIFHTMGKTKTEYNTKTNTMKISPADES